MKNYNTNRNTILTRFIMSYIRIPFYKTKFFKQIILYGSILLLAYELKSFANLFLMLFFVTYIMNELCKFIHRQVCRFAKIPEGWVIFSTYALIIFFLVFTGIRYTPEVVQQAKTLAKSINVTQDFNVTISNYLSNALGSINPSLQNAFDLYDTELSDKINEFSSYLILFSYDFLKKIGIWIFNIFLLIVLSLFFLVEKKKMIKFAESLKDSKASFVYNELHPASIRFYKSFGSMIRAQFMISLINTALTVIFLAFLGFNNLLALGFMVFLFGLIPVAGAILSSIPLALIGFQMGGLIYVFYVIALVVSIHILEAYILNPRIFSSLTHLPVFMTLIILLISEHVFGPWGLIYGLPLFVFILETIKSKDDLPQLENQETKRIKAHPTSP